MQYIFLLEMSQLVRSVSWLLTIIKLFKLLEIIIKSHWKLEGCFQASE